MRDRYRSTALITFSIKATGTHHPSTPSMAGGIPSQSFQKLYIFICLYISICICSFSNLVEIFDIAQQLQVFMYNVFFIRYDLELHMVHVARDPSLKNNIAVVGLFYKIGHHDAFLSKVQIPTQVFSIEIVLFPLFTLYTFHKALKV